MESAKIFMEDIKNSDLCFRETDDTSDNENQKNNLDNSDSNESVESNNVRKSIYEEHAVVY